MWKDTTSFSFSGKNHFTPCSVKYLKIMIIWPWLLYSTTCYLLFKGNFRFIKSKFQGIRLNTKGRTSYPPSHLTFPRCKITGLDFSSTATPVIWPTSNSMEGQFKTSAGFRTSSDTLYYKTHTNNMLTWRSFSTGLNQIIPKVLPFRSSWMANYFGDVRATTAIRSTVVGLQFLVEFSNFWLLETVEDMTTKRSQRLHWRTSTWWLSTIAVEISR